MADDGLVQRIFDAVVRQGHGLFALEERVTGIVKGVNAQAQGLRNALARIARIEAILSTPMPQRAQPMRTVNQMPLPSNVRQLPAKAPVWAAKDDESADADFEYDDEPEEGEEEAG